MLPGVFFFDKSKMTATRLRGTVITVGVLGSTIKATAGISTFNSYGNRCCSYNGKIFSFNYDGDMYIFDSEGLKNSTIKKAVTRVTKLRNVGSTCNSKYVYVVNGVSNGLLGTGALGTPSNNFLQYNIKDDKFSSLSNCPLSVYNSEIAIDYDSNDYIYYTNGTNFYKYDIVQNLWITTGLSLHGLTLGVHGLVYYRKKLYLASGNTLLEYDIVLNKWSTLVAIPGTNIGLRMFRYKEYLYICGSFTGVLQYSIKDKKFSTINSVLSLTGDIGAGVIEGSGYIVQGSTLYRLT